MTTTITPKDAIVPYSSASNTNSKTKIIDTGLSMEILNQMRDTQTVSNYEYMMLALQKEILLKLNQIEYNTRSTAVSSEFLGQHILTRFKWL